MASLKMFLTLISLKRSKNNKIKLPLRLFKITNKPNNVMNLMNKMRRSKEETTKLPMQTVRRVAKEKISTAITIQKRNNS